MFSYLIFDVSFISTRTNPFCRGNHLWKTLSLSSCNHSLHWSRWNKDRAFPHYLCIAIAGEVIGFLYFLFTIYLLSIPNHYHSLLSQEKNRCFI